MTRKTKWFLLAVVLLICLGIGAFLELRESRLDPAKADSARSACRTFFDMAVAAGATDDPEEFGTEAATNAIEEGRITEAERADFAAACADGAAAAKEDKSDNPPRSDGSDNLGDSFVP
jgi:hypothetical protein